MLVVSTVLSQRHIVKQNIIQQEAQQTLTMVVLKSGLSSYVHRLIMRLARSIYKRNLKSIALVVSRMTKKMTQNLLNMEFHQRLWRKKTCMLYI